MTTTDTGAVAARPPDHLGWATVSTPDGPFTFLFDDDAVVYAAGWSADPDYFPPLIHRSLRPEKIGKRPGGAIAQSVRDYYLGDLDAPSRIDVRQRSGPFLQTAWAALRRVPPGPPVTYRALAERAGNAAAFRAAASCCAQNAAALFVPCHRVIRSNGELGGFRYGLEIKESLIDRENRR